MDIGATVTLIMVNNRQAEWWYEFTSGQRLQGSFLVQGLAVYQTPAEVTARVTDSRGYVAEHAITVNYDPFTDVALGYDVRGNLVYRSEHGAETYYLWNTDDMLTEVLLPDGRRVAYDYDALQRRTKRAEYNPITMQWSAEYFRFDTGWNPLADYLWNAGLGESGDKELRAYYLYEGGLDSIVAKTMPNPANPGEWITLFYLADHLGSITALVDGSGSIVEQYAYDVYGAAAIRDGAGVTLDASAFDNRHLYTAREWDAAAGLYNYRYRYYSADLSRFVSFDPIGFAGGMNMYAYVGGNPVAFSDPMGLWNVWQLETWGVPNGMGWGLKESLLPWGKGAVWGARLSGFLDGYIGWSNGFLNSISFGYITDYSDPCNDLQKFGSSVGKWIGAIERDLAITALFIGRARFFESWQLNSGEPAFTLFRGGKLWGKHTSKWAIEKHMLQGPNFSKLGLSPRSYWHINNPYGWGRFPGHFILF